MNSVQLTMQQLETEVRLHAPDIAGLDDCPNDEEITKNSDLMDQIDEVVLGILVFT